MSNACLEIKDLTKTFGGVTAVDHVSFTVQPGRITALIGPNGAGKSTLLHLVSGLLRPTSGRIIWDNHPITLLRPHTITRRGIARTFQTVELFSNMTALENVMVGRHLHSRGNLLTGMIHFGAVMKEERVVREEAHRYLAMVGLAESADVIANDLPFGGRRLVEIARALATEPKLLLLDEAASGLSTHEKREVVELIFRIRGTGVTIFVVDHDMDLVMGISDHVVVLDHGEMIAEGPPMDIQRNSRVIAVYLGEKPTDA